MNRKRRVQGVESGVRWKGAIVEDECGMYVMICRVSPHGCSAAVGPYSIPFFSTLYFDYTLKIFDFVSQEENVDVCKVYVIKIM